MFGYFDFLHFHIFFVAVISQIQTSEQDVDSGEETGGEYSDSDPVMTVGEETDTEGEGEPTKNKRSREESFERQAGEPPKKMRPVTIEKRSPSTYKTYTIEARNVKTRQEKEMPSLNFSISNSKTLSYTHTLDPATGRISPKMMLFTKTKVRLSSNSPLFKI